MDTSHWSAADHRAAGVFRQIREIMRAEDEDVRQIVWDLLELGIEGDIDGIDA